MIFTPKAFKALTIFNTSAESNILEIALFPKAKEENNSAL